MFGTDWNKNEILEQQQQKRFDLWIQDHRPQTERNIMKWGNSITDTYDSEFEVHMFVCVCV